MMGELRFTENDGTKHRIVLDESRGEGYAYDKKAGLLTVKRLSTKGMEVLNTFAGVKKVKYKKVKTPHPSRDEYEKKA